jgi:hypothetical protein
MDEEGVEVDDLFGDTVTLDEAAALQLPLHTIQAEGLAQHLDDLHRASTERLVYMNNLAFSIPSDRNLQEEGGVVEARLYCIAIVRFSHCQHQKSTSFQRRKAVESEW